jgi:hypothetical protein
MAKTPEPPHGLPLGHPELLVVGQFIVLWNLVEQQLDDIACLVSGINPSAVDVIMKTPHVPARADIFEEIFKSFVKDAQLVKDAKACASAVKKLSNFRNEVAHGRWRGVRIDAGEGRRPLIPMSAKQATASKLIRVGEITSNYGQLCRLSCRLADLNWRCNHLQYPKHFPLPSLWHDKF